MAVNVPESYPLAGAASTAASVTLTKYPHLVEVVNRQAVEVWITIDGSTPDASGANGQWCLPALVGAFIEIPVVEPEQAEPGTGDITLQAVGASAWSVWVLVEQ